MKIEDIQKNIGSEVYVKNKLDLQRMLSSLNKLPAPKYYIKGINPNNSVNIIGSDKVVLAIEPFDIELMDKRNEVNPKKDKLVYSVKIKSCVDNSIRVDDLCLLDDINLLIGYYKVIPKITTLIGKNIPLYVQVDSHNINTLIDKGEITNSYTCCHGVTSYLSIVVEKIPVIHTNDEFLKLIKVDNDIDSVDIDEV